MEVAKVGSCVHTKQQLVALQLGKDYSCPSRAYLAVSVYKKCFCKSISFLTMGHYAFVWLHHCVTALITTWYVLLIIAFSFSRKHQKFLAESSTSICNQWFASQLHQLPGLQSPAAQDTNASLTSYTEATTCLKLTDIKMSSWKIVIWETEALKCLFIRSAMNCHVGIAAQITNHSWPLWQHCTITRAHNKQTARVRACNSNRSPQSSQNYWTVLKIENPAHA